MATDTTMTPQALMEAADRFAQEHPDLQEALRIFGISAAQYEIAVRALSPAPVCTTASTTV
jgi:hypothetical protein